MANQPIEDGLATQAINPEAFSRNVTRFLEASTKAASAYMKSFGEGGGSQSEEMSDIVNTMSKVAERWMFDPQKAFEAQAQIGTALFDLWTTTLKRMGGEPVQLAAPDRKDNRFKDTEWSTNPAFDLIKQAYLVSSRLAENLVDTTEGLDETTRQKSQFYIRQLSNALSPSNFLATNPELIRETIKENGANLARGMEMLAEDIEAGGGQLRIRQTDTTRFQVGVNVATTPGKVVLRNDVIELIQYSPTTETVLERPLLLVPPWINKYYILDLNQDKSFIRWAVAQGITVFCISWVNPDERHAHKTFEDYMREGVVASVDTIEKITGAKRVAALGYCAGGTLLATSLAYMAAKGDERIDSVTFFTTQVDFTYAGDLKVFIDEAQVRAIEAVMKARGYLEGSRMAQTFNMLRPNDLIWPYITSVYLKGQAPFPFDLLFWNSDATRMPAANHSFYLRNFYLENKLSKGEVEIDGVRLDLKKVTAPIFNLATREDHIAPARSVFHGCKFFGGPVDFVLAGSGHIAGVVNPPDKPKYQYWTDGPAEGELEDWLKKAEEHPGSAWPYWFAWLERQAPERVAARQPGGGVVEPICDAPGTYVLSSA